MESGKCGYNGESQAFSNPGTLVGRKVGRAVGRVGWREGDRVGTKVVKDGAHVYPGEVGERVGVVDGPREGDWVARLGGFVYPWMVGDLLGASLDSVGEYVMSSPMDKEEGMNMYGEEHETM